MSAAHLIDQEQPMPDPQATAVPIPLRIAPTVNDVVELLDRYAAADRALAAELERIDAEVSSSRRVSRATVARLQGLVEDSLLPGVRAKADLDALPRAVRRAGVARWAQLAVDRARPLRGTA